MDKIYAYLEYIFGKHLGLIDKNPSLATLVNLMVHEGAINANKTVKRRGHVLFYDESYNFSCGFPYYPHELKEVDATLLALYSIFHEIAKHFRQLKSIEESFLNCSPLSMAFVSIYSDLQNNTLQLNENNLAERIKGIGCITENINNLNLINNYVKYGLKINRFLKLFLNKLNNPDSSTDKIVVFGDSVAVGIRANENWLQKSIANSQEALDKLDIKNTEVINVSVPGATTRAKDLLKKLLDLIQPSAMIITLGGNDAIFNTPVDEFINNYIEIVEHCYNFSPNMPVMIGCGVPKTFKDKIHNEYRELISTGDFYKKVKEGANLKTEYPPNIWSAKIPEEVFAKENCCESSLNPIRQEDNIHPRNVNGIISPARDAIVYLAALVKCYKLIESKECKQTLTTVIHIASAVSCAPLQALAILGKIGLINDILIEFPALARLKNKDGKSLKDIVEYFDKMTTKDMTLSKGLVNTFS